MNKQVAEYVQRAVSALLPDVGENITAPALHAALYPYVVMAAAEIGAESGTTAPPKSDRRSKPWQVVIRFWNQGPNGPELGGETDPLVVEGTGELATMIPDLAAQLYGDVPEPLSEEAVKARLPQLRNNLGRAKSAALRIDFGHLGAEPRGTCQADVYRLDA